MSDIDLDSKKNIRKKTINIIALAQKKYIQNVRLTEEQGQYLERQFKRLRKYLGALLRKKISSGNQTKNFITVNKQIQRIFGYCKTNRISVYPFEEESNILNSLLIAIYESNLETNYDENCASYGESLLNCYLDTLITLFDNNSDKDITKNFSFLNYPETGKDLELDVNFEKYKLAFEFQGEYHYHNNDTKSRDEFKLLTMSKRGRILIPINVSQLQSDSIINLILDAVIANSNIMEVVQHRVRVNDISRGDLNRFLRLLNNFELSSQLYQDSFRYLDYRAGFYISKLSQSDRNISATTPAPKMHENELQISYDLLNCIKQNIFKKKKSPEDKEKIC